MTSGPVLGLFPEGSRVDADGELVIGGCRVTALAAEFGTPLFAVDTDALTARAGAYRTTLAERWPRSRVAFASKAFPCTAVYRLLAEAGIGADVSGPGEIVMALRAGVDPAQIILHGNAKSDEEIRMALEARLGLVVIDNRDDIRRLRDLGARGQGVLLRVSPEVRVDTHEALATGARRSKFGVTVAEAGRIIEEIRSHPGLVLRGLHLHVGSQIMGTGPFVDAVDALAPLGELGPFDVYDLGGGLGERYTYRDNPPSLEDYVTALTDRARTVLPTDAELILEPGRSLVARSTATVYRVLTVKRGDPTFVAVDGGMGDNLEVSLYGQRFEATVADRVGGGTPVDLVGRHCESGDLLSAAVELRDPRPGDVVAVPVTGAYAPTMANNYNGNRRPPVVFCARGTAKVVLRRETLDDLVRRDVEG